VKTYKFVLTGGPCGGKTSSLNFLTENLIKEGYSVNVIDESVTRLLNLGYKPNKNISTFDFQDLLFKIQFIREYFLEGRSNILLCDRGLFDGKAYIDENKFNEILEINKTNDYNILKTYDGALYFKSISFEFPEDFIKQRIFESAETGMRRDTLCKTIWEEKIIPCNYNNIDGFKNKQKIIYNSLKEQIKLLKNQDVYNLNNYYNEDIINIMYKGIYDILEKNNISYELKNRTKELIKW
jgi:hypothetical protein